MKKIYLQPETEITTIRIEGLLKLSTGDSETVVPDIDPNDGNDGPGVEVEDDGDGTDLSKGWNLWGVSTWDD